MKQIFFLLGSLLFVAVAKAQSKVTTTASIQITKLVDKSSPVIIAPVVSPVPSPVNLLAKALTGWNIPAPKGQPAPPPASNGGATTKSWDVLQNSIY